MDVLAEKKVKLAACGEEHMGCLVLHGWVPDDEAQHCMACKKSFTPIRRRVSDTIIIIVSILWFVHKAN